MRHRGARRTARLRAVLGLGVLTPLLAVGSFAFWTDDVAITGTTFTAGVLDLRVNDLDTYPTSTLSMTATPMRPGDTSAEVMTIRNNGTVPLKYTLTGGLAGADAAQFGSEAALRLTIVAGGSRSGTGNAATCSGGTTIFGPTALTATLSTPIIATPRGPVSAAGTDTLCFQVTFDSLASNNLQGRTASASFTATGTSDVS